MKAWQAIALGSMMVLGLCGRNGTAAEAAQTPFTLSRDGQPAAAIILASRPTKAAQFAAFELQWHVKAISGATLPIVREGAQPVPTGHVKLWVGATSRAAELGLTQGSFRQQERTVQSGTNEVLLVGKDAPDYLEVMYDLDKLSGANWPGCWEERGTLHAVYDFLRDACGVRWLSPTETGTFIPQQPTLTAPPMNARRRPVFTYRNTPGFVDGHNFAAYSGVGTLWGHATGGKADGYKAWDALAYANLHQRYPTEGGYVSAQRVLLNLFLLRMRIGGENMNCNHSIVEYYDRFWKKSDNPAMARRFVEKRPEFFAKGCDSAPVRGLSQLCFSNKELIKQVAQDARDYYDGRTDQGIFWMNEPPGLFPVEPNDSCDFCKCPDCRRLIEEGKGYGDGKFYSRGIHSDYFFSFVNAVQQELAKTHPDKGLMSLSYMTHAWPPKSFALDPRVAIQFAFADSGLEGDSVDYENEWKLVKAWGEEAKKSGRALYLWLYLGHVHRYIASMSEDYYCFPDFQAHTVAEQMKAFKELGYRGAFWCGNYLEPDAYVSFRMMDDADLDVDKLLDEYFTGLCGVAGAPLKKMYLAIESAYRDLTRKPQLKRRTGVGAMSESWGQLGAPERMAEYGKLMEEAKGLAKTDREKRNVEIFDRGFWQYMLQGRAKFENRQKLGQTTAKAPVVMPAGGDPAKVAWDKAAELAGGWFERGGNTPVLRKLASRMAHDGEYFYLELVDPCDTSKLAVSKNIAPFDDWEIFAANQRALPYRQIMVGPTGLVQLLLNGEQNWQMYVPMTEPGIRVVSDKTAPDKWVTRLAIPLKNIVPGGVQPGGKVYLNVIRVLSGPVRSAPNNVDVITWIPYTTSADLDRLAEVTLEKP